MTTIINSNPYPVQPGVIAPDGTRDFVHLAPRGRLQLPPGYVVDPGWLASSEKITVIAPPTEKTAPEKTATK